jgi:hypothetical protein
VVFLLTILILIFTIGCKKKEIELTRDNFSEFDKAKLTQVYIDNYVSNSEKSGRLPFYGYKYYINDLSKIEVIKLCIRQATQFEYDIERFKKNGQASKDRNLTRLIFETKKVMYTMRIGWNDEFVYGFWWESPQLLKVFEKWQLFEELSKADPAWPEFTPKYPSDVNTFQPSEENEPQQSIESNEGGLIL